VFMSSGCSHPVSFLFCILSISPVHCQHIAHVRLCYMQFHGPFHSVSMFLNEINERTMKTDRNKLVISFTLNPPLVIKIKL
jgi:hypothetical protein